MLCHNTNIWENTIVFLQYKCCFFIYYQKKDLNPKMKMGTNSFGVHIVKPFSPEPKTDTTAQLEKRFLQPTRRVGRFLQPTQSECFVSVGRKGLILPLPHECRAPSFFSIFFHMPIAAILCAYLSVHVYM